ncbi:AB hydrolase-1 domain-containing protein [Aphelenchoides besseyi]|nr:AB hydrolase-1 domain-containing protein [Aphelenchoides besseyi]
MTATSEPSFGLLLLRAFGITVISSIYATKTVGQLFCGWTRNVGHFFYTKRRDKKPRVLEDGWNHRYVQLSKIKMHYVEKNDSSKPLMLFVHGFPEFWYCWRYQLRHFGQKDYHVVAVDLRGYGESTKLKGYKNYDLSQVAGDLIELIEQLGHSKVILCGHDWGGATSYRLAMMRPDLIERMIVLNIYHPAVFAELLKTPEQRKKSWYFFMFQIPFVPNLYLSVQDYAYLDRVYRSEEAGIRRKENFTDEDLEAFKFTISRPGAIDAAISYNRAAIRQFRPSPLPKDPIEPKTLMIFGEEDAALSVSGAKASLEFCRDAELRTIPGASHWVQQDRPDLVNLYIEEFLSN